MKINYLGLTSASLKRNQNPIQKFCTAGQQETSESPISGEFELIVLVNS